MIQAVGGGVSWFPQDYAHLFYLFKGLLALIATLTYLTHMSRVWTNNNLTHAQRWRYGVLFYLSVLLTVSTAEQVNSEAPVAYRNLAALVGTVLLLIAAVKSLREDGSRPATSASPRETR